MKIGLMSPGLIRDERLAGWLVGCLVGWLASVLRLQLGDTGS